MFLAQTISANALDIISVIVSAATPILILILTGIGWVIGDRIKRQTDQERQQFEIQQKNEDHYRQLEESLRPERVDLYNKILEPFIVALTKDSIISQDKRFRGKTADGAVNSLVLSLDYKTTSFQLALIGSDSVVRAFNKLMQHLYKNTQGNNTSESSERLMKLLGEFLLEIRRSVGNENTELDNLEMLEWLITDIQQYRSDT